MGWTHRLALGCLFVWLRYGIGQAALVGQAVAGIGAAILANHRSRITAPASGGVIISLTTYGPRLRRVYLTIESLLQGTVRAPIVLWLEPTDFDCPWPASVQRLADRGVQVCRAPEGLGPHTKYWPSFLQWEDTAIVTVDDDVLYPPWFLERLIRASSARTISAYRAHRITLADAAIAPYRSWSAVRDTQAHPANFATGVCGVLYPPEFVAVVREAGEEFLQVCPRADDIWLHRCALRSGLWVRQVEACPRSFPVLLHGQFNALWRSNVWAQGNDEQIARTYTEADIALLSQ